MGSKKRSSSSLEEEVQSQRDAFVLNPLEKKKMKKDNKVDGTLSVMPMERRKKRKALAKERRHAAVSENEKKAKEMDVESVGGEDNAPVVSSSSGGLPEFHIGVFKDLASAEGKAREAAVEAMVRELWLEKLCAFFEVCSAQAYPWSFFIERDAVLRHHIVAKMYSIKNLNLMIPEATAKWGRQVQTSHRTDIQHVPEASWSTNIQHSDVFGIQDSATTQDLLKCS